MAYIPMIDPETGEIDRLLLSQRAMARARQESGNPIPPSNYVLAALKWCGDRAAAERLQWRDDHGLPREGEGILTDISTWTDTFRRTSC
jgi:hypothetical protein